MTATETALDFTGLLDVLGHTEGEFTSVIHWDGDRTPITWVGPPSQAPAYAAGLPTTANVFFGVNPTKGPARRNAGRGKDGDITRLAGLPLDLDFKEGGCASRDVALAIIAELGIILGTRCSAIVDSGHGEHAYWPIEDGQVLDGDITKQRALLKRWGRLVAIMAGIHRVKVDSVFDPTRVMRLPGSHNNKAVNGEAPPLVAAWTQPGGPLTMAEAEERLSEVGVPERDEDKVRCAVKADGTTEVVSSPDGWTFADRTCGYVATMIGAWATDRPKSGQGRNPWVYDRFVRLFCAVRNGCITEADYERGATILAHVLTTLVTTTDPVRSVKRFEIAEMNKYGIAKVASKTDAEVLAELGKRGHDHGEPAKVQQPDPQGVKAPHLRDRLLNLDDLAKLPPTTPLIDGLIYRNTLAQLSGGPGSYKTFLAVTMGCCLAMGLPLGTHTVSEPGTVVYVAAEGANDVLKRVLAWCEVWGVDPGALRDRFLVLPLPIQLGNVMDVSQAAEVVAEREAAMLVLDTRARCTLGLEENSATEQGRAIEAAETIRRAAECAVVGIHHTPRAGNAGRGSNTWDGAVWSDLRVEGEALRVKVHCEKHKDVPSGCDHYFTLRPHTVSEGLLPQVSLTDNQRRTLVISGLSSGLSFEDLPARHMVADLIWTIAPPEGLSASDLRDGTKMPKTTLYEAARWGVDQGYLRNVGTSRRSRWVAGEQRPPWLDPDD